MAITTGAALALGGGALLSSILGGIFGSSSQSSANKTNLQAARETNELNKQMFDQSIAYQNEMFDKTNAYNSPKNQVALLQKAGINPAAVYGSGSTADASMPSSPSAPSMVTGHVDPIDYSWIPNSIDMGVNAYFNNQLLNNQVVKGKYDAQITKVNAEKELRNLEWNCMKVMNDAQASGFAKEQAQITLDILRQTKHDTITQAQWSTKIMEQEYEKALNSIAESKLRQKAQTIANEYAPRMNEAQLKQYHASVAEMYASAREHDSAAVLNHARKALVDLEAVGVSLDNQQKDSIMDALVDQAYSAADDAYFKSEESAKLYKLGQRVGEFTPADRFDGNRYGSYRGRDKNQRHYRKLGVRQ